MSGAFIKLTASDGHVFEAYQAGPVDADRGLVVIQEIFGVNSHIRSICDRLANDPAKYPWLEGVEAASADNSFPQWLNYLSKRYDETDKLANGPLEFLNHADLVIRFEALQEGFDEFMRRIGVTEPLSVTEYNITKGRAEGGAEAPDAGKVKKKKKNYTEYYDSTCVEVVEKLYEPILKRFNYKFGD